MVAAAAEHEHHPHQERRVQRVEVGVVDGHHVVGVQGAAEPHHHRPDGEGLQPHARHVLAVHRRGGLVLADRPQQPPPGRADGAFEHHEDDDHEERGDDQVHVGVVARRQRLEEGRDGRRKPTARRVSHEARQGLRDAPQRLRPVGQPALVLEHEPHQFGDPDRRDGQVVLTQPQRRTAHQQREHSGGRTGGDHAHQERRPEPEGLLAERGGRPGRHARGHQRAREGAEREERGDTDVEQAGVAPLDVEPQREHRVDRSHDREGHQVRHLPGWQQQGHAGRRGHREKQTERSAREGADPRRQHARGDEPQRKRQQKALDERRPGHERAPGVPKIPCGRNSSTTISTANATPGP